MKEKTYQRQQQEKKNLTVYQYFCPFIFFIPFPLSQGYKFVTVVSPNKIPRHQHHLTDTFKQYTEEFHNDFFSFQKITVVTSASQGLVLSERIQELSS